MITIDLKGPQGNAFYLLGQANMWAKQLGKDPEAINTEMTKGNYKNLLAVFEREFGAVCTLQNKPDDLDIEEEDE